MPFRINVSYIMLQRHYLLENDREEKDCISCPSKYFEMGKSPWNWNTNIENKVPYRKITKEFEWLSDFESLKIPFMQVR